MAAIKLKPGETVVVAAVDPALYPDQGLPTPQPPTQPGAPIDPGYGIDVGLGFLRPTHPIVLPPPTVPIEPPPEGPVDPSWGIDEDLGYLRPTHPIVLPPLPKPELKWEIVTAWTPVTGWIVVAVPVGNVPTPSRRA
jgi:hypothetical protein